MLFVLWMRLWCWATRRSRLGPEFDPKTWEAMGPILGGGVTESRFASGAVTTARMAGQ